MRELYQRNVNHCKKVHEIISRKGTTSAQPEERDMDEWEIDEAMGSRGRDTIGQNYATGCKLRAKAFKALDLKLSACGIPSLMILGQVKGLKEEISSTIEKRNYIEDILGTNALERLSIEIDGIGCDFKEWLNEWQNPC